jgi:hypothetical protein
MSQGKLSSGQGSSGMSLNNSNNTNVPNSTNNATNTLMNSGVQARELGQTYGGNFGQGGNPPQPWQGVQNFNMGGQLTNTLAPTQGVNAGTAMLASQMPQPIAPTALSMPLSLISNGVYGNNNAS